MLIFYSSIVLFQNWITPTNTPRKGREFWLSPLVAQYECHSEAISNASSHSTIIRVKEKAFDYNGSDT